MNIREMARKRLNVSFDFEIEEGVSEDIFVSFDGKRARVSAPTKPALARAYTLLAMNRAKGETNFEISQKANFDLCGAMLDMSFGSVTKPSAVKEYLDYMALFGMNMLMLYTEDTYEVEGYPYFGYQRGRYTVAELQEIDEYAANLGIEVIPCMQTFGHLKNFLRYSAHKNIAENDTVLLPGEEETYRFIEACIATCRKAFRSNRIHIGCDETRGLGFGKTLKRDGFRDPFLIYNEHVSRVAEICKKYNYHPMMWSDMYTTLAAQQKREDGSLGAVPQYAIDTMPEADMVCWNYYHTDNEFYHERLALHQTFNRKTMFAGGIWTWNGHTPNYIYTYETVKPALEECLRFGVREVFGAAWAYGDINHLQALSCLSVYSEFCWQGADCTKESMDEIAAFITKMPQEYCDAIDGYYCGLPGDYNVGKLVLWSDPLVNLLCYDYDLAAYEKCFAHSLEVLERYPDAPYSEYYRTVFRCALYKARLHLNLVKRYKAGDRGWLKWFAEEEIPAMKAEFEKLNDMHDELWHRDHKTQGFEKLSNHYGSAIERIRYTGKEIRRYLNGEIDEIEALEPELYQGTAQRFLAAKKVMNSYLD